jgi:serine/threonine protein kinase
MKNKEKYLETSFSEVKGISRDFFDLIENCLSQNSSQRPTANEILKKLKGISAQDDIPDDLMTESFTVHENDTESLMSSTSELVGVNSSISMTSNEDQSLSSFSEIQSSQKISQKNDEINSTNERNSFTFRYHFQTPKKIYNHREVMKWSSERVGKWLDEMNLEKYKQSFSQNHIDGEILLELDEMSEFTKFLGISSLGHIKLIKKYIQLMREFNE